MLRAFPQTIYRAPFQVHPPPVRRQPEPPPCPYPICRQHTHGKANSMFQRICLSELYRHLPQSVQSRQKQIRSPVPGKRCSQYPHPQARSHYNGHLQTAPVLFPDSSPYPCQEQHRQQYRINTEQKPQRRFQISEPERKPFPGRRIEAIYIIQPHPPGFNLIAVKQKRILRHLPVHVKQIKLRIRINQISRNQHITDQPGQRNQNSQDNILADFLPSPLPDQPDSRRNGKQHQHGRGKLQRYGIDCQKTKPGITLGLPLSLLPIIQPFNQDIHHSPHGQ